MSPVGLILSPESHEVEPDLVHCSVNMREDEFTTNISPLIHLMCLPVPLTLPQVSPQEMVQEIHQVLMDREDTCHRTCFSLQLDGNVLDNFAELKSIEGLQEGSLLKVVEGEIWRPHCLSQSVKRELQLDLSLMTVNCSIKDDEASSAAFPFVPSPEPYTVREARIHVRHIRDLLKSLDPSDAYNGVDCNSLSFLSIFTDGDLGGTTLCSTCTVLFPLRLLYMNVVTCRFFFYACR